MAHVYRMRDESTIVQGNSDSLSSSRSIEFDNKCVPIGHKGLRGELHICWAFISVRALEVGGCIDLDPEFCYKGILWSWGENGLFHGVGSGDKECTVEQEQSHRMVKTSDCAGSP